LPDLRRGLSAVIAQVRALPHAFALLLFPLLMIATPLLRGGLLLALPCFALCTLARLRIAPGLLFALGALLAQDLRFALGGSPRLLHPPRMRLAALLLIDASLRIAPRLVRAASVFFAA
jgi:hypothetical protein